MAATKQRNNVKVERERISGVPVAPNPTQKIHLGDMMKWDSTDHVAEPISDAGTDAGSTAAAAAFMGLALDSQPIESLGQNLPLDKMNIISKGLVELLADDNATYFPGDLVTIGADPQRIKKTGASSANAVGVVASENGFAVSAGVTQGIVAVQGVTRLQIVLKPQFTSLSQL